MCPLYLDKAPTEPPLLRALGDPDLEAIQSDSLEEFPLGLLSVPELRGQSPVPHVLESGALLNERHVMVMLFAELPDAELLVKIFRVSLVQSRQGHACTFLGSFRSSPPKRQQRAEVKTERWEPRKACNC